MTVVLLFMSEMLAEGSTSMVEEGDIDELTLIDTDGMDELMSGVPEIVEKTIADLKIRTIIDLLLLEFTWILKH